MVRKQSESEQASLLAALVTGEQAVRDGQVYAYSRALFDEAVSRGLTKARLRRP